MRNMVRDLISGDCLDFVSIQETKLVKVSEDLVTFI